MKDHQNVIGPENSLFFMRSLTFIGGFLNAYSYFTRGGVFVSFHTGNLVRLGLSIVEKDILKFWLGFIPIIAGFIGAVIAIFLKNKIVKKNEFYQKIILIEIISLFVIGFIDPGYSNNFVNFLLSLLTMLQLSSFRKIGNTTHNTTIMTGNLRTLSEFFTEMLINQRKKNVSDFLSYLVTFLAFPIGVVVGGLSSVILDRLAIWICVFILLVLFLSFRNKKSSKQKMHNGV